MVGMWRRDAGFQQLQVTYEHGIEPLMGAFSTEPLMFADEQGMCIHAVRKVAAVATTGVDTC